MAETETNKPRILAVGGVKGSGTTFLVNSLIAIIELAGYTAIEKKLSDPDWDKSETDFIIIKEHNFNVELEAKAALVFTSTRNEESLSKYYEEGIYGVAAAYRECIRWMRSTKLAYCMDCDLAFNQKGLHNYNNFRFMILPMNYAFNPMRFNLNKDGKTVKPTDIIERVMPEFKELSEKADEKLNETLAKKVEESTDGEKKS